MRMYTGESGESVMGTDSQRGKRNKTAEHANTMEPIDSWHRGLLVCRLRPPRGHETEQSSLFQKARIMNADFLPLGIAAAGTITTSYNFSLHDTEYCRMYGHHLWREYVGHDRNLHQSDSVHRKCFRIELATSAKPAAATQGAGAKQIFKFLHVLWAGQLRTGERPYYFLACGERTAFLAVLTIITCCRTFDGPMIPAGTGKSGTKSSSPVPLDTFSSCCVSITRTPEKTSPPSTG